MRPPEKWELIVRVACDLCWATAKWRHPLGGLRCGKCPRPEMPKAAKATGK